MTLSGKKFQKILIIYPAALGDTILALPVLKSLRCSYPDAWLEFVGNPAYLDLVSRAVRVNCLRSFEEMFFAKLFTPNASEDAGFRRYFGSFDLIIAWLNDIDQVISSNLESFSQAKIILAYPNPLPHPQVHQVHYLAQTLNPIQFQLKNTEVRLSIPALNNAEVKDQIKDLVGAEGKLLVAIHPGSGSSRKNWPVENFVEIAQGLWRRALGQPLILLGPAEENWQDVLQILTKSGFPIIKNLSVLQVAALLSHCALYIGNDSGISHLSALVKIPTLVIFIATTPTIWRPWGENVFTFEDEKTRGSGEGKALCARILRQSEALLASHELRDGNR